MNTIEMIKEAKKKGITVNMISNITNINARTIYNYCSGNRNISRDKEKKIRETIDRLTDLYKE